MTSYDKSDIRFELSVCENLLSVKKTKKLGLCKKKFWGPMKRRITRESMSQAQLKQRHLLIGECKNMRSKDPGGGYIIYAEKIIKRTDVGL